MITHNPEAAAVADRVVRMRDGPDRFRLILAAFPAIFSLRNMMAESTPLRDTKLLAASAALGGGRGRAGANWGAQATSFFWAYERGTWQYDLIVIAILAFIFLTPRSWFSDRPTLQMTDLRHAPRNRRSQPGPGRPHLPRGRTPGRSLAPQKPEEAVPQILSTRLQQTVHRPIGGPGPRPRIKSCSDIRWWSSLSSCAAAPPAFDRRGLPRQSAAL